MLYMEGVTRRWLVLIIGVHKSAFHPHTSQSALQATYVFKTSSFSREEMRPCRDVPGHPTQPPRGRKRCLADVTRGGISAGALLALWSVGLPFQSHQLHQLPASVVGFESVGLQLGLCLTWSCPVPFIFNALLSILYLCSCGVHSGCWCVVLLESSSEQLAGPEPGGDGFPPVKPAQ